MKYTKLYGKYFETVKSKKTLGMINQHIANYKHRDIYSHYSTKPSNEKVDIYATWCKWYFDSEDFFNLFEHTLSMFEVTSANTFTFTIGILLYDYKIHDYIGLIRITKEHNKLYLRNDIDYQFDYVQMR